MGHRIISYVHYVQTIYSYETRRGQKRYIKTLTYINRFYYVSLRGDSNLHLDDYLCKIV